MEHFNDFLAHRLLKPFQKVSELILALPIEVVVNDQVDKLFFIILVDVYLFAIGYELDDPFLAEHVLCHCERLIQTLLQIFVFTV